MNCPNCGAPLTVALDWCNRCFTRVELEPKDVSVEAFAAPEPEVPAAEYSRWRGGPTTMGPTARVALTLLVLGFAGSIAVLLREVILTPFAVLAMASVVAGTVGVLTFIWKRGQV